jgi:hypothetical protein
MKDNLRFTAGLGAAVLAVSVLAGSSALGAGPPSGLSVTVTNTPLAATVANSTDIAKAQGIQHPFQALVDCSKTVSNGFATFCDGSFTAPANQRLVVEYAALECEIDTGEGLRRAFVDTVTTTLADQVEVGGAGRHSLNISDHFGFGNFLALGQPVRFYADPGTTIAVEGQETGSHVGSFFCQFNLVGQAIDTP